MTDFAIDASVTMAWSFPDEATLETRGLLARMSASEAIVPAVWPFAITNGVFVGERRQCRMQAQTAQFPQHMHMLTITVDKGSPMATVGSVMALRQRYGLYSYDIAYLELAMRQRLPLATLDGRLRVAATRAGVALF